MNIGQSDVTTNQNAHDSGTARGVAGKDRNQKRRNQNSNKRNGNGSNKRLKEFRQEDYTALNDTPKNIYLAAQETEEYKKPPRREATEQQKHSGKFCRFHERHGHNTNECRYLKNLIEELIRDNKLK